MLVNPFLHSPARPSHERHTPSAVFEQPKTFREEPFYTSLTAQLFLDKRDRHDLSKHLFDSPPPLTLDEYFATYLERLTKIEPDETVRQYPLATRVQFADRVRGLLFGATQPSSTLRTRVETLRSASPVDEQLTSPVWQDVHRVFDEHLLGEDVRPTMLAFEREWLNILHAWSAIPTPPESERARLYKQQLEQRLLRMRGIRNLLYLRTLMPKRALTLMNAREPRA